MNNLKLSRFQEKYFQGSKFIYFFYINQLSRITHFRVVKHYKELYKASRKGTNITEA